MARGPCTVASFLPESSQVGGERGFQAIGRQTMGGEDEDAYGKDNDFCLEL